MCSSPAFRKACSARIYDFHLSPSSNHFGGVPQLCASCASLCSVTRSRCQCQGYKPGDCRLHECLTRCSYSPFPSVIAVAVDVTHVVSAVLLLAYSCLLWNTSKAYATTLTLVWSRPSSLFTSASSSRAPSTSAVGARHTNPSEIGCSNTPRVERLRKRLC